MSKNLLKKVATVSSEPGVYLMKDAGGDVIYVGKAGNLKKRLASYFTKPGCMDIKTGVLVKKISTFETIITGTEKEALILESNLIKQHKPRYNVIFKDDKRYPALCLDISSPYPNLSIVRKIKKDGNLYFGPFSSSAAVNQTLKIINRTFKLRKCKTKNFEKRSRPCLNYQMKACLAPCCFEVDMAHYNEIIQEVVLFLKGRPHELIRKIKKDMISASEVQDYEKAAVFRDRMIAVEKTLEKQVAMTNDFKDRDVIALARSSEVSLIAILFIRSGYLLGMRHFSFSETLSTDEEMIGTFIRQYYEKNPFIPKELLLPVLMEDGTLIEDWLCNIKGEKVSIIRPQRGEKALLVKMAMQNAEDRLKDLLASFASARDILVGLQKSFKMDRIPRRIECFDISNISGTEVVAGMVVFKDGRPQKSLYRKYKIQTVTGQDDYACMAEVLKRRYGKGEESKPLPDIVMIDGGRGHLNMAVSVINELALESKFEIIGVAKRDAKGVETEDKIYRPGRVNPVSFGKGGGDLLFLQRIRDEAHRFAIAFHRSCRTKTFMRSKLDAISGIGPKRKEALFKKFGSIQNIQAASMDELSALPGMNRKAAEAVKKGLATRDER